MYVNVVMSMTSKVQSKPKTSLTLEVNLDM